MHYKTKCIILGSGGAGCTAGIYTARAGLKPILICGTSLGGQLATTSDVENFPSYISINGGELMDKMREHAKHYGAEIIADNIISVDFSKRPFILKSENNEYEADSVIIGTGATAKWLGVKGEEEFKGFGVSACATCDGFFYRKKIVAVIGGGNSAVSEALYLSTLANKVYLIYRGDTFKAEQVLIDKLYQAEKDGKIELVLNSDTQEMIGEEDALGKFIKGIVVKNKLTNELRTIDVNGIFVAIGHQPASKIFEGQLELNERGYIITNPRTFQTSVEGVYAGGDIQDEMHKQAVIACGSGCVCALEVEKFLSRQK